MKSDYNNLQEHIQWSKNYYTKGFNYNDFVDKGRVNEMQNAGKYFTILLDKSNQFEENIFNESDLNYIDSLEYDFKAYYAKIQDSYVKSSNEDLFIFFREINKTKAEYNENEILSEKGNYYWSLLFISPYLFAFAIGIRLTKVTAEIKELQK